MEFNIYIYIYIKKRNLHIYKSLQEDIKCELDRVLSLKILQELKHVLSTSPNSRCCFWLHSHQAHASLFFF